MRASNESQLESFFVSLVKHKEGSYMSAHSGNLQKSIEISPQELAIEVLIALGQDVSVWSFIESAGINKRIFYDRSVPSSRFQDLLV